MTRDYKELLRCLRLHSEGYACTDNCICWDAEKRGFRTCSEELAKLAADAIEELLPSAQPEQQWIPCKDRLPESSRKRYWVCTDIGYRCECRWTNNRFGLGESDNWGWSVFDIPQHSEVVAWMPLPEPYKEEGENNEIL